jgi:hypothetical protein
MDQMNESSGNSSDEQGARIKHYAEILNPLFWDNAYNNTERVFEWACAVIRVSGIKDAGWDSYDESIALLQDFTHLMSLDLPKDRFPNPTHTQARLALVSYSHMIEMDVPYELLANLLRLRLGLKYSIRPLAHLNKLRDVKAANGVKTKRVIRASPIAKINEIDDLSKKAGVPDVGAALRGIYNSTIRNAVYHSDYALHSDSLRLLSDHLYSKKQGVMTPVVTFDELGEVTGEAFAFHSALLILWKRQRKLFIDFKDKILPYDHVYKGVIEYTFENDSLNGFRAYWPNGTVGVYSRSSDGQCTGQNIEFRTDGSIDFFVGLYASNPSGYSPLVETGSEPLYAMIPGTDKRPHWPVDLKPYPS